MDKTGLIEKSLAVLALANWENRAVLEASKPFKEYASGLENVLAILKEIGKSRDVDLLIAAESTLVNLERELHKDKDDAVMPSLNAAQIDFNVIQNDLKVVRSANEYRTAASTYHPTAQVCGVVTDGCHAAINAHITRLGNQMKAVGVSVPEKNVIRQRQENMKTAKKLYMDLQRQVLGLPVPEKSKKYEL